MRHRRRPAPRSLRHGMELCLKHALARHRRSVDRVADLMGLASKWSLYKWMESGRMPANLIRPFEHACGAHYVTEYIAYSAQRLAIEIPTGRASGPQDVAELQALFAEATQLLVRFYRDQTNSTETIASLHELLAAIAWHRENVAKAAAPELDLFPADEDDPDV